MSNLKSNLRKMSLDALKSLIEHAQDELDSRMDYSLRIGSLCYIQASNQEYILKGVRRTNAEVTCIHTGKNYLVKKDLLKAIGTPIAESTIRQRNEDMEKALANAVPKTTASSAW